MTDDATPRRSKTPLLILGGLLLFVFALVGCCLTGYLRLEGQARGKIRARRDLILKRVPDGPERERLARDYDAFLTFLDSGDADLLSTTTLDVYTEGALEDSELSSSEAWVLSWAMRRSVERGLMSIEDSSRLDSVYRRRAGGIIGGPFEAARFRFERGETQDQIAALDDMVQDELRDMEVNAILRETARRGDPELSIHAAGLLLPREDPAAALELLLELLFSNVEACRAFAEAELPRFIAASSELDASALAAQVPRLKDARAAELIRLLARAKAGKALSALTGLLTARLGGSATEALDAALEEVSQRLSGTSEVTFEAMWTLCCEAGPRWREFGRQLVTTEPVSEELREGRLAPLLELEEWRRVSVRPRQEAALEVLRQLGAGFECLGLHESGAGSQTLILARYRHRESGIELALIPGGLARLGADAAHIATIRRPFLIARFELSRLALSRLRGEPEPAAPSLPATQVSWQEVRPLLHEAGLRLPSEAEWEYAARAGSEAGGELWGGEDKAAFAWDDGELHAVDAHADATNAFGLADTSGNVSEWCEDDANGRDGPLPKTEAAVTRGALSKRRRGGDFEAGLGAERAEASAEERSAAIGVRPACSIPSLAGQPR